MGVQRGGRNGGSLLCLLFVLLSAACGGRDDLLPTATSSPTPATATATPSPTATPRPTATATPTLTPTPAILSPSEIFDRVSASIAYIETPLKSGSAILIEGNYLITNAHVVWPYNDVRVVFPDGSEFEEVPLVNWDGMIDLAVLGPVEEAPAAPLALVNGEASIIGSDVYLVGYPGEVDAFPQPTITRGLISRTREWALENITYFQTDATVAGGQSGGALVSERGEVIGLSGFSFADAEFALVASVVDLVETIETLSSGRRIAGPGSFDITRGIGVRATSAYLRHLYDSAVYMVGDACGPTLEVEVQSEVDVVLQLFDMVSGELQEVDEAISAGVERLAAPITAGNPYLFAVYGFDEGINEIQVDSSCDLVALWDVDDGQALQAGEPLRGVIGYPGDADQYIVELQQDDVIRLLVDSASVDPFLQVSYPGAAADGWVQDDDSGGGLFGLNAELTFRAPHSGSFTVLVSDAYGKNVGGYELLAESAPEEGPTPVAFPPTPTPIASDYGPMKLFSGRAFEMQLPASWEDVTEGMGDCPGACLADEDRALIVIEQDMVALTGEAGRNVTREDYVALMQQSITVFVPEATFQSQRTVTTASGLVVDIHTYGSSVDGEELKITLINAFEAGMGLTAMYFTPASGDQGVQQLIDYTVSTLRTLP